MNKKAGNGELLKALALFTQLGISMAACVFIGVFAGKLLDRLFGTSPWLLMICSLVGGLSSFKVMYDLVIKKWSK